MRSRSGSSSTSASSVSRSRSNSRPITAASVKHAQRLVAEACDSSADDIAHAARQSDLFEFPGDDPAAVLAEHDPTALAEVAEQLAGEERVPVGLSPHRVRESDAVVVEVVTSRGREQLDDIGVFEALQADSRDVGFAVQIGEQKIERIAPAEVRVAIACRRPSRSWVSTRR